MKPEFPTGGIPDTVLKFIFESVDSVEILEVLLHLRRHAERAWTAAEIASQLRLNPQSVSRRLEALLQRNLCAREEPPQGAVRFAPKTPADRDLVADLDSACSIRRHQIYSLIFSPLKRVRSFADAFKVSPGLKKGDPDV